MKLSTRTIAAIATVSLLVTGGAAVAIASDRPADNTAAACGPGQCDQATVTVTATVTATITASPPPSLVRPEPQPSLIVPTPTPTVTTPPPPAPTPTPTVAPPVPGPITVPVFRQAPGVKAPAPIPLSARCATGWPTLVCTGPSTPKGDLTPYATEDGNGNAVGIVNRDGAVLHGFKALGLLTIDASDVTLYDCDISNGVHVLAGRHGLTVKDCDLGGSNHWPDRGLRLIENRSVSTGPHSDGIDLGFNADTNTGDAGDILAVGNVIQGPIPAQGDHADGWQFWSRKGPNRIQGVTLYRNDISVLYRGGDASDDNAALFLSDAEFDNVLIMEDRLRGGVRVLRIYSKAPTGTVAVVGNVLSDSSGTYADLLRVTPDVWEGNVTVDGAGHRAPLPMPPVRG